MKIFCSFVNFQHSFSDPFESWIDRDFSWALQKLNHVLDKFSWDLPSSTGYEKWLIHHKKELNKHLINKVKQSHKHSEIDIYVSANDSRFVYPNTIKEIKSLGIRTINYNCDDVNAFSLLKDVAPIYDFNWTNQKSAINNYNKIGAKYIFTPFGANPEIYKPYDLTREFDVTFVGRNMGYRGEFIQCVINSSIDAHIWGLGWPRSLKDIALDFAHVSKKTKGKFVKKQILNSLWYIFNYQKLSKIFGKPVSNDEMIKLYSKSKISLNFSGGFDDLMYDFIKANKSMKLRDMEATMSGAFYLTEYSDEIQQLFEIGKEIECFKDKDDLISKIKFYLANPEKAEYIRKNAREKALKNYTWAHHFKDIFKQIGIA